VIGILLLAIAAKGSPRRRILTLSALSLIAVVVVAEVVFPRVFGDLIQGLGVRLAKVGLHDISLENRFVESAAVLKKVVVSPIIGYGLGAEFTFFNIITKFSETTWYIHNAYLFLLYKFGIVGTALYLSAYFYMLIKTARYAFNIEEESTRVMLLSFVSVMCVMLIVTVTSPQFYDRVAILVLTTIWGISAGIMKTNLVTPEERI
jgi:O-antigen ligase